MTQNDTQLRFPPIPTPGRIVADVVIASAILPILAAPSHTPAQWAAVVAGGLVAVLITAGMAWAVTGNPEWLRVRLLLQFIGAMALFWALMVCFVAGPALMGFMALVLGLAARAGVCAWEYNNREAV